MKLFCKQMKKLPLSFKEFLPIADFGGKGLSACSDCSVTPPISWWVGGKSGNWIDFQAPPPPGLLYPVSLHAPPPSTLVHPVPPCLSYIISVPCPSPLAPSGFCFFCWSRSTDFGEREKGWKCLRVLLCLSLLAVYNPNNNEMSKLASLPSESGLQWLPLTAGKTEFHSQSQNNKQRSNPRTPSFRQTAL